MNLKGFVLSIAAGFAAITSAHATDAVVADPYQLGETSQVGACDAYGTGFVAVPGTGTCVRMSGQARFEQRFTESGRSSSHGQTRLEFETRSE
jgi:hypothetical protein